MTIHVQVLRVVSNSGRIALNMSAPRNFVKADLLVYWVPAESQFKDTIPDNAVLLGSFVPGQPLHIPPGEAETPGTLVLYSLADQEIVAISKQFAFR
jgi:hypothetical protein